MRIFSKERGVEEMRSKLLLVGVVLTVLGF